MKFVEHETTELLRTTVKRFAENEIAPLANQIDQSNEFPRQLWRNLGDLGLLGITVDPRYGGSGMGYLAHTIAMEEISRASASVGLSYGAHSNLCVNQIHRLGSEQQKLTFLPKLTSGEHIGGLAMSETSAGSDVVSMKLRAKPAADGFILNGHKMWITNGPIADIVVVYARTDPAAGSNGITAFIVETSRKGFSSAPKMDKFGMRGSDTSEIFFDNCEIPKENILGGINNGVGVLMSGLDYERLVLAGGPLGIMHACMDLIMPYVHERKQFGQSIGEFQLIQAKLADLYTALAASRALVYSIAKAFDEGQTDRKAAAAAILFTSEKATQAALQTIQILGANGYINEYPAGRLLRDAKLYEIGAGTNEIRRMLIGRELFNETR